MDTRLLTVTKRRVKQAGMALATAGAVFLAACYEKPSDDGTGASPGARTAVAQLNPTEGNQASGTVTFIEDGEGIRVVVDLANLTEGKHGLHVHENGDCSAPDASSAGGHFNPENVPHAGPDAEVRHVGDFGNIVADASGRAQKEWVDDHLSFDGSKSILGKAVIVHAGEDDLTSQPSGDAGSRVACGVIEES